ncbi:MAG: GNAT family N-acetyltransferase, partial [Clostridiales bacterium]|nr:GNAT family N-acetyltransferase [Clostridiales bacterium]
MIKQIDPSEIPQAVEVIRASFATVAEEFGLTEQNCPGYTSFATTAELLQEQYRQGRRMYGLYEGSQLMGYAALTKEADGAYELHNLSVLPERRHKGYGKQLLDYCKAAVKESHGTKLAFGFMEDNTVLKDWYAANGFAHTGTKQFPHLPFTVGFMEWGAYRLKVAKFGGSSLADASQIKKVCAIILSDPSRKVIVVSAPGKGENDPEKVTDMLIETASAALGAGIPEAQACMDRIASRYMSIAIELGVPDVGERIKADLSALLARDSLDGDRFTDMLKAAGEDNCAKLVAAYLCALGHHAVYVNPGDCGMILSDEFGNARVLDKSFPLLKENLSKVEGIVIFPGFFGRTESGEVATFPRGGSDITGAILATAINADIYENFTDVDYVYSVNPKLVKNPHPITLVTYREMRELSYAGFNVYQEEALLPVYRAGIPVNIRSVNNPSCPGTRIVAHREEKDSETQIAGIASDSGFTGIYITKYLMDREIGFGRRLLSIIEEEGI